MKPLHSASGTGIGYNPGISYRGGELLGAGLAQAGNALAEGLQQFTKNREEREFADQKMQALAAQTRELALTGVSDEDRERLLDALQRIRANLAAREDETDHTGTDGG